MQVRLSDQKIIESKYVSTVGTVGTVGTVDNVTICGIIAFVVNRLCFDNLNGEIPCRNG